MTAAFSNLSDADLRGLAAALESRRVSAPYSKLQITRVLSPTMAADVTASLQELQSLSFDEKQIATTLEMIRRDRSDGRKGEPPIDLVTSGPEAPGIANRDTAVVVRELFAWSRQLQCVGDVDLQLFEFLDHRGVIRNDEVAADDEVAGFDVV